MKKLAKLRNRALHVHAPVPATGMNTSENIFEGENLIAFETVCRRLKGKVIEEVIIHESNPHSWRDSIISVNIKFANGDCWAADFEAPKSATAFYMRNRGMNTTILDEVSPLGIMERRRRLGA